MEKKMETSLLKKSGSIQVQCTNPLTKSYVTIYSGLLFCLKLHFVHLFKRILDEEVKSKEKCKLPLL